MHVPNGVLQVGRAMKRKYKAGKGELKTVDDIRKQRRENLQSVDDILADEAKQEQHRKPTAVRKPRQAKSPKRPVEDNPWHQPEPVTASTEPPPEPEYDEGGLVRYLELEAMRRLPPRDVPRPVLVAFAVDIIRQEGPQSTNALLDRAFPGISSDDRAALRQRLPKWLMASCRFADPPLTMRRERSPEGGEKRENLFGFWPEPRQGKSRQAVDVTEVLTAIAELKVELVTLRQVQSELLQRQNLLKEGFAAMLEKLTWNGEL